MSKASVQSVRFAPLLEQDAAGLERIRELRNAPSVREHMYSDHEITADEHARWLDSLRGNEAQLAWVVLYHGSIEGLVSLSAIRPRHRSAEWAFYLSPEMQGKGVGGVVEFLLLDLAFGACALEKLNCEVLATNPKVIAMHQKFGFTLEGTRRANVIKAGQRIDVALLGILAGEWQIQRPRFARLYGAEN
ncbi:UDP-4-amino-4,6-dideoxy-N-acetyl-beta-L-altrosamine N-acetyltransferase [Pseudoduganella sp. SL102]|uniref:UDP-4-amino-4, 6-dideoxy-N-acetyl-beta-L-altrosamine N-acetyltransferase n=1 Tax=Pseudoduganella sp. SL102 TaxID=2995154 RepID=UPI00248C98EF|nr:UDP-4-amino-4,6-dideoxy-N-acetyl-beta-L-altrosamine N-acetyltransferase [Pseudoduganella sp. SL102]WBS02786.1 UDP-4-amino-4,6-dideoxy-N-acetyl-beta-L-altrosamine N-acetyltransferase [Pseudoduganella sp. SL102]